jgi:hypothetical protein
MSAIPTCPSTNLSKFDIPVGSFQYLRREIQVSVNLNGASEKEALSAYRKKFIAGATATVLALGALVGFAGPASAADGGPSVTITDDTDGTANGPVTFTFTFSDDVTGFEAADITVTGGTTDSLTATSARVYTMVVTPGNDSTTQITVDVAADVADSVAAPPTGNTAAVQHTQAVDTVDPTVTITSDVDGAADGDVTFTFTFSENVTGFEAADITVTGGDTSAFTATSARVYTMVVTPGVNTDTSIRVNVDADLAVDDAGNGNVAATEFVQLVDTIDAVDPTVTITSSRSGQTATGNVTFTFTFSEAVTGFIAGDITVTGGTKGTLTAVSALVYTMVVTPTTNTTTSIRVNVDADRAEDAAGNGNVAATEFVQLVDTTTPSGGGGGGGSGGGAVVDSPTVKKHTLAFGINSAKTNKEIRASVRRILAGSPDATSVVCRPVISATNKSAAAKKLARDRSKAVCDYINRLTPVIEVRVAKAYLVVDNSKQRRTVRITIG